MIICIRVCAKTEPDTFRRITFNDTTGELACDCGPAPWVYCAHVDAALVARERYMVHPDDWKDADLLSDSLHIAPPPDWKGSWRRNRAWRGMPITERAPPTKREDHKLLGIPEDVYLQWPGVCFTGQFDLSRNELADQARAHGWRPAGSVGYGTRVLVAADPTGTSNKIKAAEKHGIPIVMIDEWLNDYLECSPFQNKP